jgi:hypothetical protein
LRRSNSSPTHTQTPPAPRACSSSSCECAHAVHVFSSFLPSFRPSMACPPPLPPPPPLRPPPFALSLSPHRHHVGSSHVPLMWRWIPKQETDATFARGSCLQGAAGSISPSLPPAGRAVCSFDPPPPCLAPITPTFSLAQSDMDDSASENPRYC